MSLSTLGQHVLGLISLCVFFVGVVFSAWHGSQMNHLAVLRSRPLETLNTSLSLSPRLSF